MATKFILSITLLGGVSFTSWGLMQQEWPEVLPWVQNALWRQLAFILIISVLLMAGSMRLRKEPVFVGMVIGAIIALLTGTSWPLIFIAWYTLSSLVLGILVLSWLKIYVHGRSFVEPLLVGAGIYGTVVGLLAHFPVNYSGIYAAGLVLPMILGWRHLAEIGKWVSGFLKGSHISEIGKDWLGVAISAVALTHFVVALMPEMMFDALTLHLFVPGHMAMRNEWGFDPSLYAMALIPMLGDWLFSIAYILAGETGSRLLNLSFIYILAWQCRDFVLWAGGSEKGARWSALIFLSLPLTFTISSSLFVEAVWAAFVVQAVMTLLRLLSEEKYTNFKTAGILLGFSAASKAVTLSLFPVLVILLLYRVKTLINWQVCIYLLQGVILFLAFGSIPYVTAWIITGNPVYPFFNEIFKSPFYPHVNFDNTLFKSGISWNFPYEVIFNSGKYLEATNGAGGFHWLLLLPSALILLFIKNSTRALLIFLIATISIMLIFYSQSYLRYIFPLMLLLVVVIGVAISLVSSENGMMPKIFVTIAMLTVVLNLLFFTSGTWSYRDFPIHILLNEASRDRYVESRRPIRRAVKFVNHINTEQAPVAFFSEPFGAGLNADALYPNWYNYRFRDILDKATTAQEIIDLLLKYGSNLVLLDDMWGSLEKRKIIEEATTLVARFGSIGVRSIKDEFRFANELLVNPDLYGSEGWILDDGAKIDPDAGIFVVSSSNPVTQTVAVKGGQRYVNKVTARCSSAPGFGRLQVNWHDGDMRFISTNIHVFSCTEDWSENSHVVISPKKSAFAVVYGVSHTETPIEITRISFR